MNQRFIILLCMAAIAGCGRQLDKKALLEAEYRRRLAAALPKLNETDPVMRIKAIRAIADCGEPAKEAIPQILPLLDDENREVTSAAIDALVRIGADPKEWSPYALNIIENAKEIERKRAAFEMLTQNVPADELVALAGTLLKGPDLGLRTLAATTLENAGPAAQDALPELLNGLKDKDIGIRISCITAIGNIGPPAAKTVARLKAMKGDEELEEAVAKALENILQR